jgi:signal transduction histidine kinase
VSGIGQLIRTARSHPFAIDLALVAVLVAATLIASAEDPRQHGLTVSGPTIVAALAACGALLCRRRWPVLALAATAGAAAVYMRLSGTHGWVVAAPMIALYHLADRTADRRRLLVTAGLAVLVLVGVPTLFASSAALGAENLAVIAGCGLALAAGDASRSRRAYVAEVEQRAHRAERSREQEARRRVTEERLRIARDLHDSMGHHIALINAQAGMGSHVFDDQPATAKQALAHIMRASRVALDDLRNTVGLLRQPGEPAAPTEPAAGVAGLVDLVDSFRTSGMHIDHEVDGSARPLPPAADRTAYRVVQESLTNVRKHAGNAATRVRLSFQPAALHIVVEDEGNGRAARVAHTLPVHGQLDAGHGIVGMRERVSALGGRLDAGPRPAGGFRVSAVLPLPAPGRVPAGGRG